MADLPFHDPSFWILVSFLLLTGVFLKKGITGLLSFLKKKRGTIAKQIAEAQNLLEEAEQIVRYEEKKILALTKHISQEEAEVVTLMAKHKSELKHDLTQQKMMYEKHLAAKQKQLEEQLVQHIHSVFMDEVLDGVTQTFKGQKAKGHRNAFLETQIQRLD